MLPISSFVDVSYTAVWHYRNKLFDRNTQLTLLAICFKYTR